MKAVTLAVAAVLLEQYIKANIPTYLWGPPGLGKSAIMHQTSKKLSMTLIDIRLSLRDPVDLRGLPIVDAKDKITRWLPPQELPQEGRDGKRGLLFLDEANTASMAMQSAAMGLVLDRKLGEYKLPPGWVPVAAGNRLSDRAAAQRMGTALKNRFAHIEVCSDLDAWCEWATVAKIHPLVIAFLRWRPVHLHTMPTGDDNSFPTPRAWESVAKIADAPDVMLPQLVAGLVGDGPAGEFHAFIQTYKVLPSIDEIWKDPNGARIPRLDQPGAMFAVASALARRTDRLTFKAAIIYMARLPKEFEVMMVKDAIGVDKSLVNTRAYVQWAADNKDVLI